MQTQRNHQLRVGECPQPDRCCVPQSLKRFRRNSSSRQSKLQKMSWLSEAHLMMFVGSIIGLDSSCGRAMPSHTSSHARRIHADSGSNHGMQGLLVFGSFLREAGGAVALKPNKQCEDSLAS
eukprot:1422502-Amphidinium_carterae.1